MADTEFSGDLMGLENAVFNPCYSYSPKTVVNCVTPVATDMSLVDYLVHGKETMTQVYDATVGDLPFVEKEELGNYVSDKVIYSKDAPAGYDFKKWNRMMCNRTPASCSITHRPEYKIIHTAPTHSSEVVQGPSTPAPTGLEIPDSMTETVPLTYRRTTQVTYERDDSRDFMEYDEAYASVTGKALSPFFGMKGMDLINAKLDFIGANEDEEEEKEEQNDYDPLYGVDYIDESDDEVKHAKEMQAYTQRLLAAAHRVDEFHREHKLSGSVLSWSYKMSRAMTSSGMMEGVDALSEYKATDGAFVFNEFEESHCPEHYTLDEMNDLAVHSVYTDAPTDRDDNSAVMDDMTGRVHYRAGHWISGDVVETRAPECVRKTYGPSVLNLVKPQPVRHGVGTDFPIATVVAIEDEVVIFDVPDMITYNLSNTGSYLHQHVKKVVERSADVKTIMSVLTSEPKLAREIGELVGMSDRKVSKVLKTAAVAGQVKVVTVKNKATEFHPRASYYI